MLKINININITVEEEVKEQEETVEAKQQTPDEFEMWLRRMEMRKIVEKALDKKGIDKSLFW